jgi:hypothetical protein
VGRLRSASELIEALPHSRQVWHSANGAIIEADGAPVYSFATDSSFDIEGLRDRLAGMDDATLERFGRSAAYMCSPEANMGRPPRDVFVLQLNEAREEWRRRFPTTRSTGSKG